MLYSRNDGGLKYGQSHKTQMDMDKNQHDQQNTTRRILDRNPHGRHQTTMAVRHKNPRSFISQKTANVLISKFGKFNTKNTTKLGEFQCFGASTKKKLIIQVVININITSGNSDSTNCDNSVVPRNTVNLLGRHFLQKLGIHLSQNKKLRKYSTYN